MTVLLSCVAVFLLYLVYERASVNRWRRQIPRTIIVTGTRGKSSVTRMLASILSASGRRVLAKTTGSIPSLILPNGMEQEVKRKGAATILE